MSYPTWRSAQWLDRFIKEEWGIIYGQENAISLQYNWMI